MDAGEDDRRVSAKSGIIRKATAAFPALQLCALGLWLAWSYLAFNAGIWVDSTEVDSSASANVFIASTIGYPATCFVMAARWRQVERLFEKPAFLYCVGAVGSLACAGVYLCGPKFLLYANLGVATALSLTCAFLTGVCTSLITARCVQLFSRLPYKRVWFLAICNLLLASVVYFVVMGASQPLSIVAFCLLPLCAATLLQSNGAQPVADAPSCIDRDGASGDSSSLFASNAFRRFCVMVLVFTFALSITRAESLALADPSMAIDNSNAAAILRIAVGLVLLIGVLNITEDINFSSLYYIMLLVVVFVPLGFAIFAIYSSLVGSLVVGLYSYFEMTIFCVLSHLSSSTRTSPVKVFGFSWGLLTLGGLFGFLVGNFVPSVMPIDEAELVLTFIAAACCVPVGLFVFTGRDFNAMVEECLTRRRAQEESARKAREAQEQAAAAVAAQPAKRVVDFDALFAAFAQECRFSPREEEIARLILKGGYPDDIAQELCVSINTVRRHIQNIYSKADVHRRGDFVDLFNSRLYAASDARESSSK